MDFEPVHFQPKHVLLQKHISYYYFLRTKDSFEVKYYAFPHTHTVLNIHRRANFEIKDYYTRVYADAAVEYNTCVQGIREYPLLAHLQGGLDKVTLLFKPLGLSCFGIPDFGDAYPKPSMIFTAWDDHVLYPKFLRNFYATDDIEERRDVLEDFLLAMYADSSINNVLFQAVELMGNFDDDISIENICEQLNINVRTFYRLFKRHLGVSPVTYRKVARFRHSLQSKIFDTSIKRLTDIAYKSNYYDQAYFNKMYRSLTGSNPQRFFKKVDSFADDRLIFEFMEKKRLSEKYNFE